MPPAWLTVVSVTGLVDAERVCSFAQPPLAPEHTSPRLLRRGIKEAM